MSGPSPKLVILLPLALALLVPSATLFADLVYDDPNALARTVALGDRDPAAFLRVRRGLSYLTIYGDHLLWGDWVPGFHLTNLLLHGVATALVVALARRLARDPLVALVTGLLFAVHPVHVEAIASIENRKEMLAMIAVAVAVLLYTAPRWRRLAYAASCVVLAIGVLGVKEASVIGVVLWLPLATFLRGTGTPRARITRAAVRFAPFAAVGAGAIVAFLPQLDTWFSTTVIREQSEGALGTYPEVAANALLSFGHAVRLSFLPVDLCADYPLVGGASLADPRALLGGALALSWIGIAVAVARRAPLVTLALAWFLLTWLPSANVVPLTHFLTAERYLYVPSFGLSLLVALPFARLARTDAERRRRLAIGVTATIVVLLAARSAVRVRDWRDSYSLWSSARDSGRSSYRIHHNLGMELIRRDSETLTAPLGTEETRSSRERIERAADEFRRALEHRDDVALTHANYAGCLVLLGRDDQAEVHFRAAVALDPNDAPARIELGRLLGRRGRTADALVELRRGLELASTDASARLDYARLLALAGRPAAAADEFRIALTREDDPEARLGLASALLAGTPSRETGREARQLLAPLADVAHPELRSLELLARACQVAGDADAAKEAATRAHRQATRDGDVMAATRLAIFLRRLR